MSQIINQNKTLTEQLGTRVDATLDKDVLTAKAFPRDIRQCLKNIEAAINVAPEVAASCYYTVPRAGKNITGASVRLAEIVSCFWGNIQAGTRVISNNGRSIVVEGWCLDLETNVKVSHEISKGIVTKDGKPYSNDMQNTTISATSSVAFRNVIFKIIPKVFIDQFLQMAMNISVSTESQEAFERKRQNAFSGLERLGVSTEVVLNFFGKKSINDIDQEDLKVIIGTGTSIKDGMLRANEAFVSNKSLSVETDQFNSKDDEVMAALS